MIEHFQNQLDAAKVITEEILAEMIANRKNHMTPEQLAAECEAWLNETIIGQKLLYFVRRDVEEAAQVLFVFESDVENMSDTMKFVEMAGNLPVFEAK